MIGSSDTQQQDQRNFTPQITPTPAAQVPVPSTNPQQPGETSEQYAARLRATPEGRATSQWAWIRDHYENTIVPQQEQANRTIGAIGQQVRQEGDRSSQNSLTDRATYDESFRPVDERLASDALRFSSAGYADRMAGLAKADVGSSIAAGEGEVRRDMARSGMRMTPGQRMAMARRSELNRTAIGAAAGNEARFSAEQLGQQRLQAAAGRGGQLQGQADQSRRTAVDAGTTAANIANAPVNSSRLNGQFMVDGHASATGLYNSATQANANRATAASNRRSDNRRETIGLVAGMMMSDRKKKKIKKVDGAQATKAIKDTSTFSYEYNVPPSESKRAPGRHMTPMADQMAKVAGGDGKSIDTGDWMGMQHAALGDIAKRLEHIERKVAA